MTEEDYTEEDYKPFGKAYWAAIERFKNEPLPAPTGGGIWKNDFDYAEFDYADYEYIDLDDNIHSHHCYKQADGWLYHFCSNGRGHRFVQFVLPSYASGNLFHTQSILYRMDWMQNAKFVRSKPMNATASESKVKSPCPNLI